MPLRLASCVAFATESVTHFLIAVLPPPMTAAVSGQQELLQLPQPEARRGTVR